MEACTLDADPGVFSPKVMFGQRDEQVFMLQGEAKYTGNVEAPFFPVAGIPLLVGAIGADGGAASQTQGNGVTGSNDNTKNGTIGSVSAGATSVSYTATTGGAPVVGDIFQIDVNAAGTTTAECRKVSAVTGTGPYTVTLDSALNYAHAANAAAKNVIAPFTHTISQTNLLPSFTVEKNLADYQSQQFAGCRVGKYTLKVPTGDNPASFTADLTAQSVAVMDTPSAITIDPSLPFVFAQATLQNPFTGDTLAQATGVQLEVDNGMKSTYTLNQAHGPKFITPVSRKVTGNFTAVFDSLDDPTWGYFNFMENQTQGNLVLTLAQSGGVQVQLTLAQINLIKDPINPKFGEVQTEQVDFTASYKLSTSTTLSAVVTNSAYLPY